MYLCALLNLARRHRDYVGGKVLKTDFLLDPAHVVHGSQRVKQNQRT